MMVTVSARSELSMSIWQYSKALRCTFFGERKKLCSSKFVQLLLLNRVKARCSENRIAQGFHFINLFISNFFGPNSKKCTCEVRAAQGHVSWGLTVHYKHILKNRPVLFCNQSEIVHNWNICGSLCLFHIRDDSGPPRGRITDGSLV